MKCGDIERWWPYLHTVVHSAFRGTVPGIRSVINNYGVANGDAEDVDSDDSHAHMAVRGLFGIEPALHKGEIPICPAFPSGWNEASIKTPDLSYEYRCEGDLTYLPHPHTAAAGQTRAGQLDRPGGGDGGGARVLVQVKLGPALPEPPPQVQPPSIRVDQVPEVQPAKLSPAERDRLLLVDLSAAYNIRAEELTGTPMLFDNRQTPMPVKDWWYNPPLTWPPTPRVIEADSGVRFLTVGRPEGVAADHASKSLVALSSWRPYPWPAGVTIPIGKPCERSGCCCKTMSIPRSAMCPMAR